MGKLQGDNQRWGFRKIVSQDVIKWRRDEIINYEVSI